MGSLRVLGAFAAPPQCFGQLTPTIGGLGCPWEGTVINFVVCVAGLIDGVTSAMSVHSRVWLAPGLGHLQRVRFLTLRVNPLLTAQTQGT
jgi:hypothetical protein